MGFPSGLVVKNPPALQENWEMPVRSLGQEDPLEEKMTTHSSDVAQKIPKTEVTVNPLSSLIEENAKVEI